MAGAYSSAYSSAFDVGGGGGAATIGVLLLLEDEMREIKKGSTDQSVVIRILDSTTFLPETGVEHDSAGIDLWYRREGAAKVSITEAALAALDSAHADGGIEHIGDGYYRLDLPDAAFATGANGVQIGGTVTGMVVVGCYVHLVDYDPQDTVRFGLTALPNAAADGAGGLPISDAGGLDLDAKIGALTFTVAGKVDANSTHWGGTAVGSTEVRANLINIAGSAVNASSAQLGVNVVNFGGSAGTFASGRPEVNTSHVAGSAISQASGVLNVNMVQISGDTTAADNAEAAFDGTGYNVGNGSIVAASVTGAVGSVTGNVGGNVAGSVGSVTGNVGGNVTGSVGSVATGGITRATFAADTGLQTIRSNTAQAGGSSSITLDASASSTTDFYEHSLIYLTGGTGAGQVRLCTAYNGTTKVATVTPAWATNPSSDTTFAVLPIGAADVVAWQGTQVGSNAVGPMTVSQLLSGIAADTTALTDLPAADSYWSRINRLDAAISTRASQTSVDTIDGIVDSILDDTGTSGVVVAAASKTGYALASTGLDLVTAWTVNVTGSLSGSVGSVTGGINTGSGTITTLDALDTAQDTQHGTTQTAVAAVQADLPTKPTKNVALSNFVFLMVDATDLNTPETGLTVTATVSKDGGAFASCTNSVSEISGGFYKINLTQTEMNADVVALKFTASGAAQRSVIIYTQPT